MIRRPPFVAVVLGLGVLLGSAAGVVAKGDLVARLDVPLPTHAQPGRTLSIGWTLTSPSGSGPMGAPIIVRVYHARGGVASDWSAHTDRPSHYVASGTVPPGGIADIGIGVSVGDSCTGNVCVPVLEFFMVTDPSGQPIARPWVVRAPATSTSPVASRTGVDTSVEMLIAVVLGSLTVARALWRWRRASHVSLVRNPRGAHE
jgi:hypothetical protein